MEPPKPIITVCRGKKARIRVLSRRNPILTQRSCIVILILAIMAAGVLAGLRFFPERLHSLNVRVQVLCTAVLIFSMGVSLGSRPDFFPSLRTIGIQSLTLAVLPILLSVAAVYPLTKRFFAAGASGSPEQGEPVEKSLQEDGRPEQQKAGHPMIWIALASLLAGISCGHWIFPQRVVDAFSILSEYALYLLMLPSESAWVSTGPFSASCGNTT